MKTLLIIIVIILAIGTITFDIIQNGKTKKVNEENKHLKEELRRYKENEIKNK